MAKTKITKIKLIDSGWIETVQKGKTFYKKDGIFLMPDSGIWHIAHEFETLLASTTYIETVEDLKKYMSQK